MDSRTIGALTVYWSINILAWAALAPEAPRWLTPAEARSSRGGCFIPGDLDQQCPAVAGVLTFAGGTCASGRCIPDGAGGMKCPGDGNIKEYDRSDGKWAADCPNAPVGELGMETCGNYPGHCFNIRTCAGCMDAPNPNDPDELIQVCQAQNPQDQTPFVDHIPADELCVGELPAGS